MSMTPADTAPLATTRPRPRRRRNSRGWPGPVVRQSGYGQTIRFSPALAIMLVDLDVDTDVQTPVVSFAVKRAIRGLVLCAGVDFACVDWEAAVFVVA